MTRRAKVICTSRISSIYNTHVWRGSDWGSDKVADNISQVSFRFADMSSNVDVIHSTCSSLDKVNFGLGKVTSRSVTVTVEAVTTSLRQTVVTS